MTNNAFVKDELIRILDNQQTKCKSESLVGYSSHALFVFGMKW